MEETDYLNCLEEIVRDQVVSFTAKGKTYNIYPISLGKKLLINRQLQNIQFDEKLGKQMIFQTLFSGIIEDANNKMLDVMKNQSMSADEKFKNYVDILDVMTTQILGQQGAFNDLISKYKDMASEKGVSLFSSENEQQTATANGISSITYEQATNIDALLTAGNITREQTRALVDLMRGSVENVNQRLNELINLSITRNSYLEEIIKTQKADFGFKSTLEAIEKNTRNI